LVSAGLPYGSESKNMELTFNRTWIDLIPKWLKFVNTTAPF